MAEYKRRARRAPLTGLVRERDQPASATARCAITLIRMSRSPDEPWISGKRPSAEILTLSSAPGDQLAFSAASMAGTRITPLEEAPVAATRTSPDLVFATNTPVSAKREAGWGIFEYPALAGIGKETAVRISPSCSAVVNRPLKKSSAAMLRLLVLIVAPSAGTAAG